MVAWGGICSHFSSPTSSCSRPRRRGSRCGVDECANAPLAAKDDRENFLQRRERILMPTCQPDPIEGFSNLRFSSMQAPPKPLSVFAVTIATGFSGPLVLTILDRFSRSDSNAWPSTKMPWPSIPAPPLGFEAGSLPSARWGLLRGYSK